MLIAFLAATTQAKSSLSVYKIVKANAEKITDTNAEAINKRLIAAISKGQAKSQGNWHLRAYKVGSYELPEF